MKRIFMLIATIFILSATTIIVLASGAFNGEGEPPETTFVRTTPTPATSDTPTATYIPLRELVPEEPETPEETETESPKYRDDIVSEGRLLAYDLQEIMQDYCEQYGVPYALGIAMAEIETHFDADAVSSTSLFPFEMGGRLPRMNRADQYRCSRSIRALRGAGKERW